MTTRTIITVLAACLCWPLASRGVAAIGPAAEQVDDTTRPAAPAQTGTHDDESVRSAVQEVMSAPEYRHLVRPKKESESDWKLPAWLERFLEWLFGGRDRSVRVPDLSLLGLLLRGLVYLIVLALFVLVAVLIARAILERLPASLAKRVAGQRGGELVLTTPPGELPADEYVRRAMELAGASDYKAAIRQLLLGTMSWIERAGLIRFRRGLTNRDYLRAIWRRPPCRDAMAVIIDSFDRVYFGRRSATAEAFERCLEEYRTGFTGNEATSSVAS